jgi:hypothetical protein
MNIPRFYFFIIMALLAVSCANREKPATDIHMSPIFSDNMVLQQKQSVKVWGKASPGGTVHVSFKGRTKSAIAGYDCPL